MAKSAMQELIEWLEKQLGNEHLSRDNKRGLEIAIEQAHKYLEKEKQMVIDARISVAGLNHASPTEDTNLKDAEDYYNQTYIQ